MSEIKVNRQHIYPNEDKIRHIIAEYYNVNDCDVHIEVTEGDPQYPELRLIVEVCKCYL